MKVVVYLSNMPLGLIHASAFAVEWLSYVIAVTACSLDDDVEEAVPVRRLEPAKLHRQALNVLDHTLLDVARFLEGLLRFGQRHLEDTLLNQIIVIEVVPHARASSLVALAQVLELRALRRRLVEHVRVEERTYVLVVAFQTLEDQQRRYDEEDLRLAHLQLLREGLVLLPRGLNHRGEVNELVALLVVHEVSQALSPGVFKLDQNVDELRVIL